MKRFHFRLNRLLRLKQQKERLAELKQLEARAVWELAERDVTAMLDRLSQSAMAIESRIGRPVEAVLWLAQYQHMTQLRLAADAAEAKAGRAKAALDETNGNRRTVAAEVEALLYVRGKQWQQHRAEAARVEQNRLDEMCLSRWRRPQADTTVGDKTDLETIVP